MEVSLFLASCKYSLIRVHENLVQYSSNNTSIVRSLLKLDNNLKQRYIFSNIKYPILANTLLKSLRGPWVKGGGEVDPQLTLNFFWRGGQFF